MLKKICNILASLIVIFLVIVAGLMIVPKMVGYNGYVVVSGSMEPNISVGSLVYIKETKFNEIEVGDVITYNIGDNVVTHRVNYIDEENQMIQTKGDANKSADSTLLTEEQILGKMAFSIPYLGYLVTYARTPLSITLVCTVMFIIILLNYLPDVFEKKEK